MSSLLVLNRVYSLEIQSVMLIFSTPLVNCCPSTFSLTSPPSLSKHTVRVFADHRVHAYIGRDETGLVYLPTQLERTLQLYW